MRYTALSTSAFVPRSVVQSEQNLSKKIEEQKGLLTWTFAASIIAQVVTLILSIVALTQATFPENDDPWNALLFVLLLETIVQGIELVWYVVVVVQYASTKRASRENVVDVSARYLDWIFTTPTMLVSIFFLLQYLHNDCTTTTDVANSRDFWPRILVVVLFNAAMLFLGYATESAWGRSQFPQLQTGWVPKIAGYAFFAAAMVPLWVLAFEQRSNTGVALVVITTIVWLVYGVIWNLNFQEAGDSALVRDLKDLYKNNGYNLLDIVSKNVTGFIVAVAVWNGAGGVC